MDDTQNTNAIKAREIGLQINALTDARRASAARIKTGEVSNAS